MSKDNRQATKRVKEMQSAQRAKEQRRRNLIIGGVVMAVIVVIVGVGILIQQNRNDSGPSTDPAGATADNGVLRGEAGAPVRVVMYEDFQCPACKQMEELIGETLTQGIDDKTISVEYRPVAFLDGQSTTDYSSRALATAACVLDQDGADTYFALHDLLFTNQPEEGTAGLSDEELAGLAEQAGADKAAVEKCQDDGTFDGWAKSATDDWSKAGFTGTPTILVDGKQLEFTNDTPPSETLQSAIDAAAGN